MTDYAQPSDVPLSFYQNIPEECVDAEHHPTKNREPQRIRPEPIPVNPDKESFHFFLIDTVYRVLPPPYGIEISLYGESFRGNSVAVRVYNFNPHFAIQAPEPGRWTMNHYAIFQESLEEALREKVSKHKEASFFKELILSITPFKGFDLYDYNGTEPISFLRIEVAYPKLVRECRFLLEYPLGRPASKFLPEIKAWWPENDLPPPVANPYEHKKTNRGFPEYFKIYEANVDFGFRFQVDHKIKATGWVKLDATMYQNVQRAHKRNDSQYEFTCDHHAVGWSHISSKILPPLCIYSFDGEMETAGRAFPQAVYYEDPKTKKKPIPGSGQRILQFGFRKSLDKTDVKGVHLVGSCDPVKNANEIYSYYNESDFCKGFRQEWGVTDPTFVLDYNGANFDFPYMIGRFKQLGLYQRYGDFGRRKGENTKAIHTTFNTSAHKTEKYAITLEGRVHIDVLQCLQREKKLRSYTLNAVAERFLGKRKVEMDYHLINTHQKTPKGRSDLAYYCMIDASLPHDLATELKMIINYIQMAHIAGVSVQHLLDRGQQLRMLAQVYHYSKHTIDNPMPGFDLAPLQYPYVVPVIPTYREFPKDKYEGAEVLEAKKGYHDEPVSTMDFSSLYPSIMIGKTNILIYY